MRHLSIREMRTALSRLEKLLSKEGEVIVTRRGEPIARIMPLRGDGKVPSRAALRASMKKMTVPSEVLIREDRDSR